MNVVVPWTLSIRQIFTLTMAYRQNIGIQGFKYWPLIGNYNFLDDNKVNMILQVTQYETYEGLNIHQVIGERFYVRIIIVIVMFGESD